ncbi:hypothetical protein [Kitasatospora sp. NPDC058190]|uniref:hypothetical protein n=1 Tax=Kitasatospora sp. NPDC058190 TaxID=3346371 RepID=UPI0036DB08BA
MNRLSRVLTWTAVIAVTAGAMCRCSEPEFKQHQEAGYSVADPIRTLVIQGGIGRIRVTGGSATVKVAEHQDYQTTPPTTEHRVIDGTLTLDYRCPDDHCGVGYDVEVPAATVVRLANSSGGIVLAGLAAEITAKTGEGGIRASGLTSATVDLETTNLGIDAKFSAKPTTVRAVTGSGGVFIYVPDRGPYRVSVHSPGGGVTIEVDEQDDAAGSITASAVNGGVRIRRTG